MWIMTTFGFFSIVEKPWDRGKGTLTVRARVREDLDALRGRYLPELTETTESGTADYRFRAQVPREAFAAAMSRIVGDVDYDNFKNAVAREQGHRRAGVYGGVWAELYGLQEPSRK
jgi:hypothetical protein